MPEDERTPTPQHDRPPQRRLTLTVDMTTALLLLGIAAMTLLALVVIVGVFRNTLDLTAVASVLAVLIGGIVSGVAIAAKSAGKTEGEDP